MKSFMINERRKFGTLYISPFHMAKWGIKTDLADNKYKKEIMEILRRKHSSSNSLNEQINADSKIFRRPTKTIIEIDSL